MVKLRILRCSQGNYSFRRRYISVFWKPTWWKEGSGSGDTSLGTETKVHLAHNIIWAFRFLLRTVYVLGRKVSPGRVIFSMWAGLSWKTGSSLANRPRAFIFWLQKNMACGAARQAPFSTAEKRVPCEHGALAEYLPIFMAMDVSFQIVC